MSPSADFSTPFGAWTGLSDEGHRISVQVIDSGNGPRLVRPPHWKLNQSFSERWMEKQMDETFKRASVELDYIFNGPSGGRKKAIPKASQSWDPARRVLTLRAGGFETHSGPDFVIGSDYARTANYEFLFPQSRQPQVRLNGSYIIPLRRP